MNRILILILVALISMTGDNKSFEGRIVYKNVYSSKLANVSSEQFNKMMGETQEYYIRKGDYKSVANGSLFQWQLYVNHDNKLYSKMANSETLLWADGAVNSDQVIKAEINENALVVLGYTCDELVLTCSSGVQKYYFNEKFRIEKGLYLNHKYGNWYEFLSRSNALPLKSIIDNAQFTLESTAIEAKEVKLDDHFFDLPAGAKTMKSPY